MSKENTAVLKEIFPYIGEYVLQRIISQKPQLITDVLGITLDDFVTVHRQLPIIFPETDVIFDGFSTIDLGIELTNQTLIPVEVKLGYTGLARHNINKKLVACTMSAHSHPRRIKGNILSVYNRYFDNDMSSLIGQDSLHTCINGKYIPLSESWGIICRDKIIASWKNYPPNFNCKETVISLDKICHGFGEAEFNQLIEKLFENHNYFDIWLGNQ